MPRALIETFGGKAMSGGPLAPRSRRGVQGQIDTVRRGGGFNGIVATGGTIVDYGEYRAHIFYDSGTFAVSALGGFGGAVEYLIVAGGGGATDYGFGGAGGYRELTTTVSAGTNYTITVGGGGVTAVNYGNTKGVNTSAFGQSTTGGGRGARTYQSGMAGGSGGGAGGANNGQVYGAGGAGNEGGYNPVEGYAGGGSGYDWPGGGGGAGGPGLNTTAPGPGRSNSYSGTAVTYARGGNGDTPANSGNGGSIYVGNGASGIVIIRFKAQ